MESESLSAKRDRIQRLLASKIVFRKDEVYQHPTANKEDFVAGSLFLVREFDLHLVWAPYSMIPTITQTLDGEDEVLVSLNEGRRGPSTPVQPDGWHSKAAVDEGYVPAVVASLKQSGRSRQSIGSPTPPDTTTEGPYQAAIPTRPRPASTRRSFSPIVPDDESLGGGGGSSGSDAPPSEPVRPLASRRPASRRSLLSAPANNDFSANEILSFSVLVRDLRRLKRLVPRSGPGSVVLCPAKGSPYPFLYFHDSGIPEFMAEIQRFFSLARDAADPDVYNFVGEVTEGTRGIQGSLLEFGSKIFANIKRLGTEVSGSPPSRGFPMAQVVGTPPQSTSTSSPSYSPSVTPPEQSSPLTSRSSSPSTPDETKGALTSTPGGGVSSTRRTITPSRTGEVSVGGGIQSVSSTGALEDLASRTQGSIGSGSSSGSLLGRSQSVGASLLSQAEASSQRDDDFEIVNKDVDYKDEAPFDEYRVRRQRGPRVTADQFLKHFMDSEGRIVNEAELRKRIYEGGLEESLRKKVWAFLLGYMPVSSTYKERQKLRDAKVKEYNAIKNQWQSISPAQEQRNRKFRERKHQIEKDVVRTDRRLEKFAADDAPALQQMFDILLTYSFYNFDIGYCQGMSDFLSPILYVMGDEVDAFWCFANLMDQVERNFFKDQTGMHTQLSQLSNLVKFLDPQLHKYFESQDLLNFFFCFRWILVHFKREFDFQQCLDIWEVLWSKHLAKEFHLFICVAILKQIKREVLVEKMQFDELLKFINDLSEKLDKDRVLLDAEAAFLKFRELPEDIQASIFDVPVQRREYDDDQD